MNVAYWNLHERELTRDATGRWFVNDQPLRFFHFSGFNPREPHLLSKHQTRTRLSDHPELARLCADFARDVDGSRAQARARCALRLGHVGRRTYRGPAPASALPRRASAKVRSTSRRSSPTAPREFLDWLNEPALDDTGASTVSRYWLDVYKERKDLQIVFPRLARKQRRSRNGSRASAARAATARAIAQRQRSPGDAREGKSGPLCGSMRQSRGASTSPAFSSPNSGSARPRGASSRVWTQLAFPCCPYTVRGDPAAARSTPMRCLTPTTPPSRSTSCVSTPTCSKTGRHRRAMSFFSERYTIGFWWWEVLAFPHEWLARFDLVDEVWVASQHVADALTPVSSVPVTKVTLPVSVPAVMPRSRFELGLPEGFLFMFLFDHHSIFDRKNPLATIEAFKRAFPPGLRREARDQVHQPRASPRRA